MARVVVGALVSQTVPDVRSGRVGAYPATSPGAGSERPTTTSVGGGAARRSADDIDQPTTTHGGHVTGTRASADTAARETTDESRRRTWPLVAAVALGLIALLLALGASRGLEVGDSGEPAGTDLSSRSEASSSGSVGSDDPGAAPGDDGTAADLAATAQAQADAAEAADGATDADAAEAADVAAEERLHAALDEAFVAWGRGSLPEGYADAVAADPLVTAATVVRSAVLPLLRTEDAAGRAVDELPEEWTVPVEVLAVDPDGYRRILDLPEVAALQPDEALLSRTSAAVRGLDAGASLVFGDGTRLRVAAVVDDDFVGAGEVIVRTDAPLPVDTDRYVLAILDVQDRREGRQHLEDLAAAIDEDDRQVAVATTAEVPVLRHSATVTPMARMKLHYGEFAMLDLPGRLVQQGASWYREHITYIDVPILGTFECHRAVEAPLTAAFQELIERGLDDLVDPDDFGGCWVARTTSGQTLSSHAWGTSVDLNVSGNHLGATPTQPQELIDVMARHGFVWGGEWLLPDGMHFELAPDRVTY